MVISIPHDSALYPFMIPNPVPNACLSILSRPALYMRDGLEMWAQLGTPVASYPEQRSIPRQRFQMSFADLGKLRAQFRHRSFCV